MVYSAGIIPFKINEQTQEVEFFVGHPGCPENERRDYWSYLKGCCEKNEKWEDAAIREFGEETGIDLKHLKDDLIPLGSVEQNPTKTAVAYGVYYPEIDPHECLSNMADNGMNREIDRYQWMSMSRLNKVTHPTHLIFYRRLLDYIKDMGDE